MELSHGMHAGPLVASAETVAVGNQDRAEFESLLGRALAIDVNEKPEWRLTNLILQRRARMLLSRVDRLFFGFGHSFEQ
jgi:predicted anti-sigma-YlaC factor YlaD